MKKEVELTTKSLTIDDLKNDSHVGFVFLGNEKGYVSAIQSEEYVPICSRVGSCQCNTYWSMGRKESIKKVIDHIILFSNISKIVRFRHPQRTLPMACRRLTFNQAQRKP